MRRRPLSVATALIAILAAAQARAQDETPRAKPQLIPAVATDAVFNGVATTMGGRIFLPFPRQDRSHGIEAGEIVNGQPVAYPNAAWNSWSPGRDGTNVFVWVNALRVGPDGDLWIVDAGAPGMNQPRVPCGPKLVQVDLTTNTVRRIYPLEAATSAKSYVDDVRFNGPRAYLTDAGTPGGLIVLDLRSGAARRVLSGARSTTAQVPLTGQDGHPLINEHGLPVVTNADQLEVSPDGRWFYYQPCTGPLYRIETRYLDDPSLDDTAVNAHVDLFARTRSTGGTAIDAAGNIYISQVETRAVDKITPQGVMSVLVRDPRLDWVDAMWIDDQGYLWMPAAQLDRIKGQNGGVSTVQFPAVVYKTYIGQQPVKR